MPEPEYVWLPREDLLAFEEIDRLIDAFVPLGVEKIRLTGGEPLLRRDLPVLVGLLRRKPGLRDLALTTNAVLLPQLAARLRDAGLHRLTISLDTLRADRFRQLTRQDALDRALAGIDAATAAGFARLKLNMVVIRGFNDDEIPELLEYARRIGAEIRFVEYMDVGGATRWAAESVVPRAEILQRVAARYGEAAAVPCEGSAPAETFVLPDGTRIGIIASTTAPFCASCDRARLTADGRLFTCLYASEGLDLRAPLRSGASTRELAELVAGAWRRREDRGAEARLHHRTRSALASPAELRENPHLEMHTRGG